MKRKAMVPLALMRVNEHAFKLAGTMKDDTMRDRYIRIYLPDWRGPSDVVADLAKEHKQGKYTKHIGQPLNGEYSLAMSAGGSRYHEVSPDERGPADPCLTGRTTSMRVTIEEPARLPGQGKYPKGTRRLPGRSGGMLLP